MSATAEELESLADAYLSRIRGRRHLPRSLFLVGGLSDEVGACFDELAASGRQVFDNWDAYVTRIDFPTSDVFPTGSARAGQPMNTFLDFGDLLREKIGATYPDHDSGVGEFDVVAHSMGGLDTVAAMVPLDSGKGGAVPPPKLSRAFNFIACDSPFRGIPSADVRAQQPDMQTPQRQAQCRAIAENSPELLKLRAAIPAFCDRIERLKCLSAYTAVYVEVSPQSGNLLGDPSVFPSRDVWQQVRQRLWYRAAIIPGAVHSGDNGLTSVSTGIAEIFSTILNETW